MKNKRKKVNQLKLVEVNKKITEITQKGEIGSLYYHALCGRKSDLTKEVEIRL